MRSAIACLLILGLAAGGCDRPSAGNGQGEATPAPQASLAAAADASTPVPPGEVDRGHAGTPAPDYPIALADGSTTTLAKFRGKPLLVNLWATWCAPCIAEMPTLDALAAREVGKLNVVVISQDLNGAAAVTPFFKAKGLAHLTPWLDPDLRFSTNFGANLPVTILYSAQGKEIWRISGPMEWTGDKAVKLLAEAR